MKLTHLPELQTRAHYTALEERFVVLASGHPDVVAVYNAGSVSQPGISDLDFVVVLEDTLSARFDIEKELSNDLLDVMAGGSVLKVPRSLAPDIRVIDDFSMTHLAGEESSFAKYASQWYEVCRVLDWLPERLCTMQTLKDSDQIDVRRALGLLKSVTVSLEKLTALIDTFEFGSFIDDVNTVRANWFRRDMVDEFQTLIDEAPQVIIEALNAVDVWLQDTSLLEPMVQAKSFRIPRGPKFGFGKKAGVDSDGIVAPYTVATFLAAQAQMKGFVAGHVRDSFSPALLRVLQVDSDLLTVIATRMEYVESLTQFFRANGLQKGLLKYGWFLHEKAKS